MKSTRVLEKVNFGDEMEIRSSSGRNVFSITSNMKNGASDDLCGAVRIEGVAYRNFANSDASELVDDFLVVLPQILLSKECLKKFENNLNSWLLNSIEFSCQLTSFENSRRNRLLVSLGASDRLISSLDKPAFTIQYQGGAFLSGSWSFLVDQSCIRIAIDGLRMLIGSE